MSQPPRLPDESYKGPPLPYVCGALGPLVPEYRKGLQRIPCNRLAGHQSAHRHYNPKTFDVIAEWDE